MICPHCAHLVKLIQSTHIQINDTDGSHYFTSYICPNCRFVILMHSKNNISETDAELIYPKKPLRKPPAKEVPAKFAQDFTEAGLVLEDSPKASAALSRRVLQLLLHDHLGIKIGSGKLAEEIQRLLDRKELPSYIAEPLDAIRNVGNYAAHPNKDLHSGEIVEVDKEEAEWLLAILEMLFDFYFVQPEIARQKLASLNAKLATMGKPPTKAP